MRNVIEEYTRKTGGIDKNIPIEDWVRLSCLADDGKVGIMQAISFAYKLGCLKSET